MSSLAHNLPFLVDSTYSLYSPDATTDNVDDRRPYSPGILSSIRSVTSRINSSYNGLQVTGEKRFGQHFEFKTFYTYSKSLATAESQGTTNDGGAEDYNNLNLDRGPTDYDRRHNSVTSVIWRLDYFNNTRPLLRNIINGWQLSAIISFRSGNPYSI